jgi:osmotically-inducible protein OsmY
MQKSDNILATDVKDALGWDPYLDASRVVVKAENGKVILTGAVHSYSQLLAATDDAWSVSGVTDVNNELLVGPEGEAVEDGVVAADAVDALNGDTWVPRGAVSVSVTDGWVTLSGSVNYGYQRREAADVVGRVRGVLGITNKIVVDPTEPMPADVADRINKAFVRDAVIDDSLIEVTTSGHTVYLDGQVGSGYAMNEAVDTAWQATGVSDVVNRLVVVPE